MELEPQEMLDESMPSLRPAKICAEARGGIFNAIRRRGSDCFKLNTLPDEITRLNVRKNRSTTESPQAFPTILELAQLSQHAYLKDEKEVPFQIEHMDDWICIGTGHYSDGYCGAAYVNYVYSHVVIAHGGTEFFKEFYKDVICTDIGGVFLNNEVSQISSAYIFTKLIVNLCSATQFSISVTGHSLGGWLAQICAFYIAHPTYISRNEEIKKTIEDKQKSLEIRDSDQQDNLNMTDNVRANEPYHLHTVTFDSPGCRRALKRIIMGYYGSKAIDWKEKVETLDFTVIIAPSNIVNTCGEHVGYILALDMPGVKEISRLDASHDKQYFVDHLSSLNAKLMEVHDVHYRKAVQSDVEPIILAQWYMGRENSCQVNIFSPKELAFLNRTQFVLRWSNNTSLASSDKRYFEDIHGGARIILDMIEQRLKNFIQHFNVTHNVIEFLTINRDENIMSELILALVKLLRLNREWWNGDRSAIQDAVRDLPRCRQMVCESEGSLYIEGIPKLRYCTTIDLCNKVRYFLASDPYQHCLVIKSESDERQCRLYMVHLFHCFEKPYIEYSNEPVLFLNISGVERLTREIDMKNIFSLTNFGLIVVECDSEINEKLEQVIRGMIADAETKNKKLVIVTSGGNGVVVPDINLALQFENLSDKSKEFISQCPVHMRGNTFRLGMLSQPETFCDQYLLDDLYSFFDTVNSSEIIFDIFDGKYIDLTGESLPVMAQHYIPRTLFQNTLDADKLIENVKYFTEVIVVSNCDSSIKEHFPELILLGKNLIKVPVGDYTKLDFLNVCESEYKTGNVHWFRQEGSVLVWQMSSGQPCFDYLKSKEGRILDSDLHGLQHKFIILADEPGMGKSAAITKLYLEYESIGSHFNWPVYINLNNHQVELKNTAYSYDSAVNLLAKAMNLDDEFKKSLFRFCLGRIGNVTFFIDSFDEISQMGQDFVVKIMEKLKSMDHSKIRVWIATRNYAKYELEQKLGTKSYRFHRIDIDDQKKFLVNYWTHSVPVEQKKNDNRIEPFALIFAERAIRAIQEVLGTDHTFIGIPLQLVLLAIIYNDNFLQLLEKLRDGGKGNELRLSENDWKNYSDKFSTTLELYDLFIEKKFNIWLADKFKFDTRTDWMENTLKTRMNEIHSQAAFLYVSSSILINSENSNINVEPLSSDDSIEMNRAGFCETSDVSKSNFRFYHQTIAEYYTAKYLVDQIKKNNQKNNVVSFLKTHYYKPYFKKIRYFLDSLLCTRIPFLKNLELLDTSGDCFNAQSLRERFTNVRWQRVDALDRNILHYAMAYGNHDSGIFWMIAKDLSLFHKKDLLGETCLSYLCLSENFAKSVFPYLREYREYKKEIPTHKDLGMSDKHFIPRIGGVQVLYSIFCGSEFQVQISKCVRNIMELYSSSGFNRKKFLDFITTIDGDQLNKNVQINTTWLSLYTVNPKLGMVGFLSRLCLHNSLDKKSKNNFLNDWFETCFSETADCCSELGAELITACKTIDNLEECVLKILRNNLPHYYHKALPYMDVEDEYALWKSCTGVKKRKMLCVMGKYNFYSLVRAIKLNKDFLRKMTKFVYSKSKDYRCAWNKSLVKAFHIFTVANVHRITFDIYRASDAQTRKRMIKENFELKTNTTHDSVPTLIVSVRDKHVFENIWQGNNPLWKLRSVPQNVVIEYEKFIHLLDYPYWLSIHKKEYTNGQ